MKREDKPLYYFLRNLANVLLRILGGAVGIFPEGTRNRTNQELLKFKYGAVKIAKKTNTPIIPFAIKGNYKPFRKGLSIEFGKPVNISKMEVEEANNYIKNEVLNILRK